MRVKTARGLLLLRARDSRAALAALGAVVFVSVLSLGLTLGSVQHGAASGGVQTLDSAAPQRAAVRVTTHLAGDGADQAGAAHELVARLFPAGTVRVHDTQRSLAVDVVGSPGVGAVFGVEPDLLDFATVTSGAWPADGVAVQEDAAAALGLAVGDELTVGDPASPMVLAVAATWRADDPAAAHWYADPLAGSGRSGDDLGLVVAAQHVLGDLPTQLFSVFTLTAEPAALSDARRDAVAAGFDRLPDAVTATDELVSVSSDIDGSLPATLDAIASASRGAAAIAVTAMCIVGVLALVAVLQLCTLLATSRRRHTALARARGLSIGQLVGMSLAEALLAVVPGAALGAVVAVVLLSGRGVAQVAVVAGAVAVATLGCLVAVVVSDLRPDREGAGRSPAGFFIAGGVVAALAVLATWQLYSRSGGAGGATDLVAATSPALALVAVSVIGTALLIPVAPVLSRALARRGRFVAVLAGRQVAGRVVRYIVPVLALAIAVASAVFGTGIATTWAATQRSAQFTGVGGDVSVAFADEPTGPVTAATLAGLDDVDAASALVLSTAGIGGDTIPFLAVHPAAAVRVLGERAADAAAAIETTTPDDSGLELPAGARIAADLVSAGDGSAPVAVFAIAVWAADADGALVRVPLTADEATDRLAATLPESGGPWRLLAVESQRTGVPHPSVATLTVTLESQQPVRLDAQAKAVTREFLGDEVANGPLPVVVTEAFAARVGAAVGDPLTLDLDAAGTSIDARVTAVVAALPGIASRLGVATDLRALDAASLRTAMPVVANEIWLATDRPGRVSAAVARTTTTTAIVASEASTSQQPVLAAALAAFWLAAIAAGVLAVVALAAFLIDDARGRRGEIFVLRAIGFSPGEQSSTRGREQVIVLGFALVVGAAGGAVATAATVGPFLAAVVPAAAAYVKIWPAFDVLPWLAFCAGLGVATAAVALSVLARVRRAATRALDEERAS